MLISPTHQQRYRQYYQAKALAIPARPHAWQPQLDQVMATCGSRAWTVLDYGCGPDARLSRFARYFVANYDPGIPMFEALPDVADVVVCWHVLEHVERACLDAVLAHISRLARKAILIAVSCQPSTKVLPDDTPWHTIVEPPGWWSQVLQAAWGRPDGHRGPALLTEYRGLFRVTRGSAYE